MKSLFEITPFTRPAFSPKLGDWFGDLWSTVIKEGPEAYKAYQATEKAEEEAEAAQARAAAAQSQATAATTQSAASAGKIMGIPTGYVILGGLGLVALGIVAVVATRK